LRVEEEKLKKEKENFQKIESLIENLENYKLEKEKVFLYELEQITEKILDELTDGKFSQVKIRKEDNKIRFYLIQNGVEYSPSSLSGGEQTIFSLALRLAIAEVYNTLNKNAFLILDEPTIHLDSEVIKRFILYLQNNKKFKQLIIISHDEEFKNIADRLIKVEKSRDGTSLIKVIT